MFSSLNFYKSLANIHTLSLSPLLIKHTHTHTHTHSLSLSLTHSNTHTHSLSSTNIQTQLCGGILFLSQNISRCGWLPTEINRPGACMTSTTWGSVTVCTHGFGETLVFRINNVSLTLDVSLVHI